MPPTLISHVNNTRSRAVTRLRLLLLLAWLLALVLQAPLQVLRLAALLFRRLLLPQPPLPQPPLPLLLRLLLRLPLLPRCPLLPLLLRWLPLLAAVRLRAGWCSRRPRVPWAAAR